MPAEIFVPAFPQRSPPRLLPAAACGGLRSAPDHRTRRALLHLSYSCAPQTTHAALVTHGPARLGVARHQTDRRDPCPWRPCRLCCASARIVGLLRFWRIGMTLIFTRVEGR